MGKKHPTRADFVRWGQSGGKKSRGGGVTGNPERAAEIGRKGGEARKRNLEIKKQES